MNKNIKNIATAVLLAILFMGLLSLYTNPSEKPEEITLSTLSQEINDNKIKSIEIDESKVNVTLSDGKKQLTTKEAESSLSETLVNFGVSTEKLNSIDISIKKESASSFWLRTFLPFFLPFILIGLFLWFMFRQAQKGSSQALTFGLSRARIVDPNDKKRRITFKDVAGETEAKEELFEIVEFLKEPKKFLAMGAKIPKGVLLMGPPGTGKTLLAKAVAGEAGVPFFNISGSEFVEMFVGVGASRVRDLFKQAKKQAPAIVFIDEIDAVGRHRGAGLGGGHDEREQTLNQILVEMDGFETDAGVIVIAATNRPDVLDPALLRPGRFDRRVILGFPDMREREAILTLHIKNKPIHSNVDKKVIAQRTPGFSGADLANLLNEAALLAARRNRKTIRMQEITESIEKVLLGPARKSRIINEEEKKTIAYHEAGHALVADTLPNADPVQKVSIVSRGSAGGYTLSVPTEDKSLRRRDYFIDELAVLLGAYTSEHIVFGEVTTGASNDLERATHIAREMVTRYGMSSLGPRTFGKKSGNIFLGRDISEERDYSDTTASAIDKEVSDLIKDAFETAKKIILEKRETLNKIAEVLLEKETLEKDEFDAIISSKKS
ncbi:MAG: ATP-dependent zinc metalloprotease FtsH [Candidatus Moraniibacteriota bacterium]|nr:MAG: ATP-dependent zinc metalloprotease FtsH [Candidatus Moranbacteria bacterium]